MSNATAKEVARSIVTEFAPQEAAAFDYLWEKFERDPGALDPEHAGRPAHGVGGGDLTLASLVVIPIVSALIGEGVKYGVQQIANQIRARRTKVGKGKADAEDDRRLAEVVERNVNAKLP